MYPIICQQNNLLCVEWDVKLHSLTHSLDQYLNPCLLYYFLKGHMNSCCLCVLQYRSIFLSYQPYCNSYHLPLVSCLCQLRCNLVNSFHCLYCWLICECTVLIFIATVVYFWASHLYMMRCLLRDEISIMQQNYCWVMHAIIFIIWMTVACFYRFFVFNYIKHHRIIGVNR